MLLRKIRIENSESEYDIQIIDGKFSRIENCIDPLEGEQVINCEGLIAFPPFVESHVHLDTCLSLDRTGPNISGTLFEGIQLWSSYRSKITKLELVDRAQRLIDLYAEKGVQHLRSHVDISENLSNLETLLALREDVSDIMDIQLVAFPQDGVLSSKKIKLNVKEALKLGADVVGGIPHFELTNEHGIRSIHDLVNMAVKYDKLVDMHCDEIDDGQSRFLETLAAQAYESGLNSKVTASHATAMHSYNMAYCSKLFRLLRMSDINIVANPLVNLNLGGRFDNYPKRRGITRVKELLESGINVSFGHDDLFDPFYPLGNGDMREPLGFGLNVCHMMAYEEIMNSYRIVTYNGAKTMNIQENYGIEIGKPASLIAFEARSFFEVLRDKKTMSFSMKKGRIIRTHKENRGYIKVH